MAFYVLSSSPNRDGLTAACAQAAVRGIRSAGGNTVEILLNEHKIDKCHACDDGWGTCLKEHRCREEDDFQGIHARLAEAQGFVMVTPVYWGEMSESAKAFLDRLRRCEASRSKGESILYDKPVLAVAAAGGSGGGMITCLASLENWIHHVQGRTFDLIPVNRWSRTYKLAAIRAAGKAMALETLSDKG